MEDVRILGLHGKGASGPIMRAQMTALARAAGLEDKITYVSGPLPCKPYHSLEHFFPPHKFTYHAWYHQPSYTACRQAHFHVQSLLEGCEPSGDHASAPAATGAYEPTLAPALAAHPPSPPLDIVGPYALRRHFPSTSNLLSDESLGSALAPPRPHPHRLSPSRPSTPQLCSRSAGTGGRRSPPGQSLSLKIPKRVSFGSCSPHSPPHFSPATPTTAANRARSLRPALSLSCISAPESEPNGMPRPAAAPSLAYDGVVCFSQGCAVLAGHLLAQAAAQSLGCTKGQSPQPKFAIFICGSRPYPARDAAYSQPHTHAVGAGQRPEQWDSGEDLPLFLPGKLIGIPTVHLIGRTDPARLEGFRLASLCDPRTRTVIEFDGGHAPPRKQADLERILPVLERLVRAV